MQFTVRAPSVNIVAKAPRMLTQMESGMQARAKLYRSRRWRRARDNFLCMYQVCCTPDCGRRSVIVDHRDGHQREDWLERFWDQSTWQAMCSTCHAGKSRRELAAWRDAGEGIVEQRRQR